MKDTIVVFDGAMGTMLYSKGIYINQCFEQLNLTKPDLVKEIHREYIQSGAEVIETNTFGANRLKLAPFGLGEQVNKINIQGVQIAREVAGENVYVAGSIGPIGKTVSSFGSFPQEEVRKIIKEQATPLVKESVDLIILETFGCLEELTQAIRGVREVTDLPLIAQMSLDLAGETDLGISCERIVEELSKEPIDVVGFNCSVGPAGITEFVERVVRLTDLPLSAQPNAGLPQRVESRFIYLSTPEYMAEYAKRMAQLGVSIVGGCCGTTPDHISAIASVVKALKSSSARERIEIFSEEEASVYRPVEMAKKSIFAKKLAEGAFVTSVEIDPPYGTNSEKIVAAAKEVRNFGVDAVNIADGPRATARMSPMALALIFQNEVGIDVILHYCCRDRNIIGMQSDLLGAHSLGLNNILIVTGDPPKLGDYPFASAVFDVDSIGLVKIANRLNHGQDLVGKSLGGATQFCIGVGVNPGAIDLDYEIERFEKKVEAGAEFAFTQPLFDLNIFEAFHKRVEHLDIPILAGILPLYSYRNAEFLHNEVPGMQIPQPIRDRMSSAGNGDAARMEGIAIAQEALKALRPMVQGAYLMPPFGKVALALKVLEALE